MNQQRGGCHRPCALYVRRCPARFLLLPRCVAALPLPTLRYPPCSYYHSEGAQGGSQK